VFSWGYNRFAWARWCIINRFLTTLSGNPMQPQYQPQTLEAAIQKSWEKNQTFRAVTDPTREKFYCLSMFPYPSGRLHMGHVRNYTIGDVIARYQRMRGKNVLQPMGWDAFGMPAENAAMNHQVAPAAWTYSNIDYMKNQLKSLGFAIDWSRELATCKPDYYRWEQWLFTRLFEKGLIYRKNGTVNWDPVDQTVLANEQVIDGRGWRSGALVEKREIPMYYFRITDYAEELLRDLDTLDGWPERVKTMQRNWIGKSTGANVTFKIKDTDKNFTVFTTRPDTLFGATYAVLAPEHALVDAITSAEQAQAVADYKHAASLKSDLARTDLAKEKTGVWTGAYAINPVNGKEIPIWIADYVLASYGTGAVMAVPAHDQRDWEFAKQFDLPIVEVLEGGNVAEAAYTEDGLHVNSDFLDGLNKEDAIAKIVAWLEEKGCGQEKVTYRLRDWLFSRQRYWGEPIPIIHWEDGTSTAIPESELPLVLPVTKDIRPSGTGESPLANLTDWLEVTREDGVKGRRETNTMPQWAGSSWYYLRYIDPHNTEKLADEDLLKQWLPVDIYVGGAEHAVLHLLYARFWHKFLYDLGVVPTKEPFQKLFNQGMILGTSYRDHRGALVATDKVEKRDGSFFHVETGEELEQAPAKMSKSLKNVVNPDDVVEQYGADTLRVYEMFMGPLDASIAWSEEGLEGSRKFLDRVYRLITSKEIASENNGALDKVYNETVKSVTEQIESMKFNTAIAQLMVFVNAANKEDKLYVDYAKGFIQLIAPFAPHLAEELWQTVAATGESISYVAWPTWDESKLVEDEIEIVVQIKGKVRAKLMIAKDLSREELQEIALADEKVKAEIDGKEIVKVISVPNKLVNIVVK